MVFSGMGSSCAAAVVNLLGFGLATSARSNSYWMGKFKPWVCGAVIIREPPCIEIVEPSKKNKLVGRKVFRAVMGRAVFERGKGWLPMADVEGGAFVQCRRCD